LSDAGAGSALWSAISGGLDWRLLGMAFGAFALGGLVKGTIGVGLPLVAVPLLSLYVPATQAIVLVMMPVLVSNLWQAWQTGVSREGVMRFMPLIAGLLLATLATVPMTLGLSDKSLRAVLASVVLLALALMVLPVRITVPPRQERWWSAVVGTLSGVMGGVSSLAGPVIISYLMSLRLPRDVFVGTISVIYLAAALPLYGSMALRGRIGLSDALLSLLALLPSACGLLLGQRLRGRLDEVWFRRVLLAFLALVALALFFR
jgi:uncharacterized protein